jgi:hypothetical protein
MPNCLLSRLRIYSAMGSMNVSEMSATLTCMYVCMYASMYVCDPWMFLKCRPLWPVCMYVCVYVCMCVCMYMLCHRVYECFWNVGHFDLYEYMYVYIYIYVYIYMHVLCHRIRSWMFLKYRLLWPVCMCVYIYIYMYEIGQARTFTQTHIHTYIQHTCIQHTYNHISYQSRVQLATGTQSTCIHAYMYTARTHMHVIPRQGPACHQHQARKLLEHDDEEHSVCMYVCMYVCA